MEEMFTFSEEDHVDLELYEMILIYRELKLQLNDIEQELSEIKEEIEIYCRENGIAEDKTPAYEISIQHVTRKTLDKQMLTDYIGDLSPYYKESTYTRMTIL